MTRSLFDRVVAASSALESVVVDADGRVFSVNTAFAAHVGEDEDALRGRALADFLTDPDADRLVDWLMEPPTEPVRLNFLAPGGAPYTLQCLIGADDERFRIVGEPDSAGDGEAAEDLMRLNNELATMARERARRQRELERTRKELQETLDELQTSYWHLQKIQEVLPVCMQCGKVKTDAARWQTVAEYLRENEIFLSHGYCPSCAETVFREAGLEPMGEE